MVYMLRVKGLRFRVGGLQRTAFSELTVCGSKQNSKSTARAIGGMCQCALVL